MTATTTDQTTSPGELMNCLLKGRSRFANEDEFIAFALAEVRRFMRDLRTLNIEIAVRNGTGKLQQFYSPKEWLIGRCDFGLFPARHTSSGRRGLWHHRPHPLRHPLSADSSRPPPRTSSGPANW
jgi:hypothetical protein